MRPQGCLFVIFRAEVGIATQGIFQLSQERDHGIYEERQGYSLVALILPVANTEPGHWELFIPDNEKWRALENSLRWANGS